VTFLAPTLSVTQAVGHAQDEEALALVWRADFRRREQSSLNRETQLLKVSPNPLGASDFVSPRREHAGDVLDEDEPRPRLHNDAAGGAPQVALVEASALPAGERMRLARDAANEAVHAATPAAAVEGSGIAPQRRRSHSTRLHLADQVRAGECFPLHQHDWASAWTRQLDSEVQSASAGAEADEVEGAGTNSHIHAASISGPRSVCAVTKAAAYQRAWKAAARHCRA
jgi:hypothetical protein